MLVGCTEEVQLATERTKRAEMLNTWLGPDLSSVIDELCEVMTLRKSMETNEYLKYVSEFFDTEARGVADELWKVPEAELKSVERQLSSLARIENRRCTRLPPLESGSNVDRSRISCTDRLVPVQRDTGCVEPVCRCEERHAR
eukprot:GFYU01017674.1.p2 GENE.GFYU01017674.1~~GFYU01017674.1.p2  ORF type:complete len:143 (-),score=25.11 GFYU01017674.1:420-848(-)